MWPSSAVTAHPTIVATIDLSGLPRRLTVLRSIKGNIKGGYQGRISIKGDAYENMVSGIFDSWYNLVQAHRVGRRPAKSEWCAAAALCGELRGTGWASDL